MSNTPCGGPGAGPVAKRFIPRACMVALHMTIRRFLRGQIPRHQLEAVADEVVRRYGEGTAATTVEAMDADNWLSTPAVVDGEWFLKVISPRNSRVHTLLTASRNVGAFSSGSEGLFERFETPLSMAEHEFETTRRMRELGVNAPEPVATFEHEDLGVLVFRYLPSFRTFDELSPAEAGAFGHDLFGALARLHADGIVHGDLRSENVLVADDELHLIDATAIGGAFDDGAAYDLACALGVLEPAVGARGAVRVAMETCSTNQLLEARDFLDFVALRPDHELDPTDLKAEIEKVAARDRDGAPASDAVPDAGSRSSVER